MERLWSVSHRVSLPATIGQSEVTRLARGMVISLDRNDGITRLELVDGLVWVTGTPGCEDTILRAGGTYDLGERWPYVIEALSDAEFTACRQVRTRRSSVSAEI